MLTRRGRRGGFTLIEFVFTLVVIGVLFALLFIPNAVLGRLKCVTSDFDIARGDTDGDGDVDQLTVTMAATDPLLDALAEHGVSPGDLVAAAVRRFLRDQGSGQLRRDEKSGQRAAEPCNQIFLHSDVLTCSA